MVSANIMQIWVSFIFFIWRQHSFHIFGKSLRRKINCFLIMADHIFQFEFLAWFFFPLIKTTLPATLWQMSWTWQGKTRTVEGLGESLKLNLVYQNSNEYRYFYWCILVSFPDSKSVPSNPLLSLTLHFEDFWRISSFLLLGCVNYKTL